MEHRRATKFLLWIGLVVLMVSLADSFHYHKISMGKSKSRFAKEKCPKVKPIRNFDLAGIMGFWYVVQYYASSEEAPEYSCMKSVFGMNNNQVTMNFTYTYANDPLKDRLQGNLTWSIPNFNIPSHWVHAEDFYEGIYNTYIIDTDNKGWGLIMHCAEKSKSPRYLSALLLSREETLGTNIINFLREKLPRYDIDISFMFPISHEKCSNATIGYDTANEVLVT